MEKVGNMTLYLEDFELHPKVTIGTVDYPAEDMSSEDILKITERIPYEQ